MVQLFRDGPLPQPTPQRKSGAGGRVLPRGEGERRAEGPSAAKRFGAQRRAAPEDNDFPARDPAAAGRYDRGASGDGSRCRPAASTRDVVATPSLRARHDVVIRPDIAARKRVQQTADRVQQRRRLQAGTGRLEPVARPVEVGADENAVLVDRQRRRRSRRSFSSVALKQILLDVRRVERSDGRVRAP